MQRCHSTSVHFRLLGAWPLPPSPSVTNFALVWKCALSMLSTRLLNSFYSHLDRDGDGYISVGEVAVLLEELGIDVGEQQAQPARQGQEPRQGHHLGQLPGEEAGQKLLGALANKEPSRVNFEEFLQFNSQVSNVSAACEPVGQGISLV